MVGFTTFFTQLPVLSLIANRDVTPKMANDYPELYKELTKARVLTFKTFVTWTLVSIYEGEIKHESVGTGLSFKQDRFL